MIKLKEDQKLHTNAGCVVNEVNGRLLYQLHNCLLQKMFWDLLEKSGARLEVETARIDTKQCGSAFPSKNDVPYSELVLHYKILYLFVDCKDC